MTCDCNSCISFTKKEIEALKEIAKERIWVEEVFLTDENGEKYPSGGYSGWAKAMRGDNK